MIPQHPSALMSHFHFILRTLPAQSSGPALQAAIWSQVCTAAAPCALPVSHGVVPDLLHQLEDAGQRRPEHIHSQEVLLPRGHGGFHKDLLDVGHGSTDVLRGDHGSMRHRPLGSSQQKQSRNSFARLCFPFPN